MSKNLKNLRSITGSLKKTVGKITADGWSNIISGLNIAGKDRSVAADIQWVRTNQSTVEALFSSDDIAGKIAKMIPFDACREGITWKVPQDVTNDQTTEVLEHLDSEFERLKVWETFNWAWTMARAYGGALVFVSVDDGMELDEPLVGSRVRKINNLYVIDRWDVTTTSADIIGDLADSKFGTPEFYQFNAGSTGIIATGGTVRIHNSRVIRFDGERLPTRLYVDNNYWHDSIYTRLYDAIRNYTTGHGTLATILQETNQPVFKIEGLHQAIAQDEDELVLKRLQIVNTLRSTLRAVVLDTKDEFQFMQSGLAGVADLMKMTTNRLVAATDIPHTRLLGESPGSALGEGGKSELIDYYDVVAAMQETELRGPVNEIKAMIFSQSEDGVAEPEGLTFEFDSLYQQDQEAVIRTRAIQATIDDVYMRNGVYDAFEVADSRFGSGEYSFETTMDMEDKERERDAEAMEPTPEDLAEVTTSDPAAQDIIADPEGEPAE